MKNQICDACGKPIPDPQLGGLEKVEHQGKIYNLHRSCALVVKASPDPNTYLH